MMSPLSSPTSSSPPTVPHQGATAELDRSQEGVDDEHRSTPCPAKRSRPNSVHNSRNDIASSVIVWSPSRRWITTEMILAWCYTTTHKNTITTYYTKEVLRPLRIVYLQLFLRKRRGPTRCIEGDSNLYYLLLYSGVTITECIICMVIFIYILWSLKTKRKNANNYSECFKLCYVN